MLVHNLVRLISIFKKVQPSSFELLQRWMDEQLDSLCHYDNHRGHHLPMQVFVEKLL